MGSLKLDNLNFLLKAPSKDVVVSLCEEVFLLRDTTILPDSNIKRTSQKLSISDLESKLLLMDLKLLIKKAIFTAAVNQFDVAALFPDGFHKNLADLLTKILVERLPQWKLYAANNLIFLPRLVDFDWRVDIKASSDSLSRMSVPTCLLQLQVQEPASQTGVVPSTSDVVVELSRQTLDTMLDGLGKIRDQLSSVVGKQ